MILELNDGLFYRNGVSGASRIVGNDMGDSTGRRVARYTFQAPATGASEETLTFHIAGLSDGSHIPIRFFIGTEPDSHINAGPESGYTGELTLAGDWMSFSGEAAKLLMPGKTYYLWVFPGEDSFGFYSWGRTNYTSTLEATGAACGVSVVKAEALVPHLLCVVRGGKLWLCAPYVCRGGQLHLLGPGE